VEVRCESARVVEATFGDACPGIALRWACVDLGFPENLEGNALRVVLET
jgi:hypothetical protein